MFEDSLALALSLLDEECELFSAVSAGGQAQQPVEDLLCGEA